MDNDADFLEAIKAAPKDLPLRLVYADWLDDCGDPRSEYLRVDGQLQALLISAAAEESFSDPKIRQLRSQLTKLGKTLEPAWVAFFDALRPKFVSCRACGKVISAAEGIDTNPRNYRKMKTSRYCRRCYEDAVRSQMYRGIESSSHHSASREYHGGGGDDE